MSDYAEVPQKLKDLPNWVVWELPSKKPYDPKSPKVGAKADDPATWASFDTACNIALLNSFDGIGFEFRGTQIVGIDFDSVLDNGDIDPFAAEILLKLGNPYCEISPSGRGLHAFVECTCEPPKGGRKFSDGNHFGIEIYFGQEKGRYFTITGQKYSGEGIPTVSNLDIAYFMMSQCQNVKFKKLWMGDVSDYGDDHSRADCALAWQLAQVFGKDPQKIEWAMSASKLCQREKWDRADYRLRTISKALESKVEPTEAASVVEPEAMMRTAGDITPKRIKWLWNLRVPLGKITLFCGNPDNGKSLASTRLAAICSTGEDFPDCKNDMEPSDVLMLVGEDDLDDTAVPRLMAAGATLSRIHFLEGVRLPGKNDGTEVRLDMDIPAIEQILEKNKKIKLIVIDPISNYLGKVSMISEQDARSILIPLKRIAAKAEVAIVVVMHLNKKSELDAISRVGGAMAFIGVARASWLFQRDKEDEEETAEEGTEKKKDPDDETFSMLRVKGNLAKSSNSGLQYRIKVAPVEVDGGTVGQPYVEWNKTPIQMSADQALGNNHTQKHSGGRPAGTDFAVQEALDFIREYLGDGPKASTAIYRDATGLCSISRKTMDRASQQLVQLKTLRKFQKAGAFYWELVENTQPIPPMHSDSEDSSLPLEDFLPADAPDLEIR